MKSDLFMWLIYSKYPRPLNIPPALCVIVYFCTVGSWHTLAPKLGQRAKCVAGWRRIERGASGATELYLMQGPDAAPQ